MNATNTPAALTASLIPAGFTLSGTEVACGVTYELLAAAIARTSVIYREGLAAVVDVPYGYGLAIASAAARAALGRPVEFAGVNTLRQQIYRPAD